MARMFCGYYGWMCYDCRTVYHNLWDAIKNQFTNKCCKDTFKITNKKQFSKILKKNIKIHKKFNKIRLKQMEREDVFGGK